MLRPKGNWNCTKNTGKRLGKGLHDTCWYVVLLLYTLHSVLEFLHIRLQGNSQTYEQWLAVKHEEDRKIRSSLTHKLGMVPLRHVGCYLLILAVYFKFQRVFFPSPDPRSWQCSSLDQLVESRTVLIVFNTCFCVVRMLYYLLTHCVSKFRDTLGSAALSKSGSSYSCEVR